MGKASDQIVVPSGRARSSYPSTLRRYGEPMSGLPQIPGAHPGVRIGDIYVTPTDVTTPLGQYPVKGTRWEVHDLTVTTVQRPTWAIVCTVLFALVCLLGLLFLAVKETVVGGNIQVTVSGDGWQHTTVIPATTTMSYSYVVAQINWARQVAAL